MTEYELTFPSANFSRLLHASVASVPGPTTSEVLYIDDRKVLVEADTEMPSSVYLFSARGQGKVLSLPPSASVLEVSGK